MPDVKNEDKDFDQEADEFLDKEAAASTATVSQDDKTKTSETPAAEADKTEKVEEVEADTSLSVEEKIAKVKEILGDDEKAIDAYIKSKGYHKDPAWIKQREIIDRLKRENEAKIVLSEEDKIALVEFKKFRSTPEYIKTSMKAAGYTDDAINKKLQEAGFDVAPKPQDDVQLILSKLNIDVNKMSSDDKAAVLANIEDIVKIANVLIEDRLGKVLPKELKPIQEHLGSFEQSNNASKLISSMRELIKTEGILDFDKDIEPTLNKFLDENPDALQQDVFEYFKEIHHQLTVERLKAGGKQQERDEKRGINRQNIPLTAGQKGLPKKTGNFDTDADAFFASANFQE